MVRKCLLGVLTLLLGAILPPTAAGRGGEDLVVGIEKHQFVAHDDDH